MSRLVHGLFALGLLSLTCTAQAQTLAAIRASHHFSCGTVQSVDDWNGEDIHGNLSVLGGEICRAVAIAIQGATDGFEIQVFPAEPEALAALKAGNDSTGRRHFAVGHGGDAVRRRLRAACVLRTPSASWSRRRAASLTSPASAIN